MTSTRAETFRYTLDNGLRVVHAYIPGAPMAAVDVLYNVGSRDEQRSLTGLAHLFEHLMFGGSINEPDFDGEIERAGGMSNAWTSNDFTNFYETLPPVNIEVALRLESDRMLSPLLTEQSVEVQKNVVIEEFKQVCLNTPYGDYSHLLKSLAYKGHPYSWPAIGITPDHVASVTRQTAETFFLCHYAPNNAVLVVVGDIDPQKLRQLIDKWFGDLPRRNIAPRTYAAPQVPDAPRRLVVERDVPSSRITVAFPMPARNEPGYIECDLITDILASGNSSRFYNDILLADPRVNMADASIAGSDEQGLLMLNASTDSADEATLNEIARSLVDNARRLATEGPTEIELRRAKNRYDSQDRFGRLNITALAQNLALAEMQGNDPDEVLQTYSRVTADDIKTVAATVLDPQKASTLLYKRKQNQ